MAQVRQDKVQIQVEIDGKPVQNTISDLQKSYRQLNREIRDLTPGTELFNKKAQELGKVRGYLNDARDAANAYGKQQTKLQGLMGKFEGLLGNIGGRFGQLGGLLKGIGSGAALTATGIGAAAAAIGKGVTEVIAITKEFSKLRREVNSLTGATGPALDEFTGKIKGIADTFDQDFNEVLRAANTVSKTFGIGLGDALDQISEGFVNGANTSNQYLDILTEYPAQLETVGLSFEEANALILKQTQDGIFSDKGIDAIKEAGLRLRELPDATKDALDGIGLVSDEVEKGLRDGSTTLFDVISQVGGRLGELEANSPEVGAAIADIFGGPGEDAGLEYLVTLGKIEGGIEGVTKASAEQTDLLREELQATQELSRAKSELASRFEDIVKSGGNFITKVQVFLIQSFNKLLDIFSPLVQEFKALFDLFRSGSEETGQLGEKTSLLDAVLNALFIPLRIMVTLLTTTVEVVTTVAGWFARLYENSGFLKEGIEALTAPFRFLIKVFANLEASLAAIDAVLQAVATNIKTFVNETILDLQIAAKEVENFFSFSEAVERELEVLKSQKGSYSEAYTDLGKAAADAYNQAVAENAKKVDDLIPEKRETRTGIRASSPEEVEKRKAAAEKVEKDLARYIEDLQLELQEDSLEKRIALINLQADREIAALKGNADQVATATALLNQQRDANIAAAEAAAQKEAADKKLSAQEQDQQDQLQALENYHAQRQAEIVKQALVEAEAGAFASKEEAEAAIQERMLAQLKQYLQARIDLLKQFGEDASALEAELANLKIDELLAPTEGGEGEGGGEGMPEWYDRLVAGLEAARQVLGEYYKYVAQEAQQQYDEETAALEKAKAKELNLAANSAKKREEIELKYQQKKDQLDEQFRKKEQARAVIQSGIDTALLVLKALQTPPAPNLLAGGAAGLLGGAQTAFIAAQSYADGGFTGEGFGKADSSGFKPAGIVHEGEYVNPKWQVESPKYRPLIEYLNQGRLRGYAGGGFVSPVTPNNDAISAVGRQTNDVLREEIAGLRQDLGRIQFVMPVDEAVADLMSRKQVDLSARRSQTQL